jgi:hypothetical protein
MKRTVVLALALVFVVGSAFIVTAQKKVVDAKQLQSLLPGAPAGFKVDEPASGSIGSTPFGRISSEAAPQTAETGEQVRRSFPGRRAADGPRSGP